MTLIRLDANGDPFEVGRKYKRGGGVPCFYIGPSPEREGDIVMWIVDAPSPFATGSAKWSPVPDLLDVKVPRELASAYIRLHNDTTCLRPSAPPKCKISAILRDALDKREAT